MELSYPALVYFVGESQGWRICRVVKICKSVYLSQDPCFHFVAITSQVRYFEETIILGTIFDAREAFCISVLWDLFSIMVIF